MRLTRRLALAAALLLTLSGVTGRAAPQSPRSDDDGVARLLLRLQQVMQAGKPEAYLDLVSPYADRQSANSASLILVGPNITRAVVRERDRVPLEGTLPGDGYRLMAEVFIEYGDRARVATWRLDVRRASGNRDDDTWVIAGQQQLTVIDGLYRLSLNTARQYRVRDLSVRSEDLEIRMADGRLFVSEALEGPTCVVLIPASGGSFTFRPTPETEREQVKLFAGSDAISSEFDEVFLRVNPGDFDTLFPASALRREPAEDGLVSRAEGVFRDEVNKSFGLDMGDLSRDSWSLVPASGDILVELRTRRFQALTYVRSSSESEDITVFDRKRRRNISTYASKARVARHGRFFNEDTEASYDITDYLVEATFAPAQQRLEGRTRLRLTPRENALSSLTLKLADSLNVRSVYSSDFGRLLSLKVRNQSSVVINLPGVVARGTELALTVEYEGTLEPTQVDREVVSVSDGQDRDPFMYDALGIPAESSLLYTTRSYWYPQSPVSDYAPAVLRLTVPEGYGVLASGELAAGSPVAVPAAPGQRIGSRLYVFSAPQPLRYLACLITRLVRVDARTVALTDRLTVGGADGTAQPTRPVLPGVFYDALGLTVDANPRLVPRARRLAPVAQDVARFYTGLIGDSPYPSLAVGVIEKPLPGGHSPAYLSVLLQPPPQATFSWGNDPAAFPNYPEFFIAHEIAHQWWGQAVGWQSYHEQWISEGFSQYFAGLYARQIRGEDAFGEVVRRMARFARAQSAQGPISLGYRLGHVRGDTRVFRSLVYNKAAVVLNTLRLLLGDEVFLRGARRLYYDWRFKKASTDSVRQAFERESGQDLTAFFENWIHTSGVPVVRVSWRRDDAGDERAVVVHVEQVGTVFDFALPVTLRFGEGASREVIVPVRGKTADLRIPFTGDLKRIDPNAAGTAIVDIY